MKNMNCEMDFNSLPARYSELAGQVAVITGSGKGVGRGIALRLGREGMRVVVNDLEANSLEAIESQLRSVGVETLGVLADITKANQVEALFEKSIEGFGTVDLLVNNAAAIQRPTFFNTDQLVLDSQIETNIKGTWLCSMEAALIMRQHNKGNIINISSVGGIRAHWQGATYDMTKGAIDALTRAMALELSSIGIRVNAVAPGAIRTERTESADESHVQQVSSRIPLGRFGTAYEVGGLVAFLASSEAAYITGQVLYIDGGITSQLHPPGYPI